jgi:alanine racemase
MTGLTREEILARGHPVWAEIDLGALAHNIRTLKAVAGSAELMGVVKGYAYGHGNPECAAAMVSAGATRLGVARVAEALHLRDAGIEVPIHVFSEPPHEAAPILVEYGLTPAVFTEGFASALSAAAVQAGTRVPVHLKVDSGMHRVGVLADDLDDALRHLKSLPGIEIEGLWSHLAVAEVPDHPFTRKQLDLFAEMVERVRAAGVEVRYRHIANSAATLGVPESHLDIVRCGIASYGLWPGKALEGSQDIRPVMTLRGRISMAKVVPAGDALSYGLQYELERKGTVVTVSAGYADGYDRRLSGRAEVLIGGSRHRVSGTITMDQFMVDTGETTVEPGEVATLIGRDGDETITAEELAEMIGTINYEVTSRVPSRVPRIYIDA